jgi:predicted nucleic acid-binding protein
VVDASVAAKWHLEDDEEYVDQALLLLSRFGEGTVELVAPDHIRYEVAAVITGATTGRQPRLSRAEGSRAISEFLALPIRTKNDSALILAAYPLAQQYGCRLYDALYLAVAQRLRIPFITADRKLFLRVAGVPGVIWIGSYV